MAQFTVARQRPGHLLLLLVIALLLTGCASSGGPARGVSAQPGWVIVQRGDTLGKIAQQADIPLLRLQRFNPGVDSRRLAVGQRLMLPSQQERAPGNGAYRYQVRRGDTSYSIARYFGSDNSRLEAANAGIKLSQLEVGQILNVPMGSGSRASAPAATVASRSLPDPGPLPSSARAWLWPLDQYTIERRFGRDANETLQPMLLAASAPAQAKATAPGRVRFASSMRQLGQVVILHHDDNMQSVYALCGELLVSEGDEVAQGAPVCTLSSDSGRYPLLFDLRHGGKPVDPARVLR